MNFVISAMANRDIQVFLREPTDKSGGTLHLRSHYTRCPFDSWETAAAVVTVLQAMVTDIADTLDQEPEMAQAASESAIWKCLIALGYTRLR